MTTSAMSPLRQRMVEDMQLRGLSARTQEAYARAVWQLAQYYHRRPDQLSDEELRQYFLYLTNQKKIARPTATIALCGWGALALAAYHYHRFGTPLVYVKAHGAQFKHDAFPSSSRLD